MILRPVMIAVTLAAALAAVSACAPAQPLSSADKTSRCIAAYQNYDQAVLLEPDRSALLDGIVPRVTGGGPGRTGAESALRQFDCIVFPQYVPDPATVDLSDLARPIGETRQRPRYLHLAIVTNNALEDRVRSALTGVGYPVRVKGASNLGRRIFIGPLTSPAEQASAEAAAARLGFTSLYTLTRIP